MSKHRLGSGDDSEGDPLPKDLGEQAGSENQQVNQELFNLLYSELHLVAQGLMNRQVPQHTLQATALISEAWVRLSRNQGQKWESRGHFLGTAARAMRSVLIDHARKKKSIKGGGGAKQVVLDEVYRMLEADVGDLLELDSALVRLAEMDERLVRLVELRYFAGLTVVETAKTLRLSSRQVQREWDTARDWLYKELR